MIIKIKNIRKWRVKVDDLTWTIQRHRPKNSPPNNWENKYYCTTLESLIDTLVDLNIDPSKIDNLKTLNSTASKLKRSLRALIQDLFEKTEGKTLESKEITGKKKKRKRTKKKK
jgi:hypothetical protein